MQFRRTFGIVRIATALLCAISLVARFIWGLNSAWYFSPDNFTAYLTVQSNVAFCILTGMSGVMLLRNRVNLTWLPTLRASVLGCTVTAGIVFALLIQQAGARDVTIAIPWSDLVLHFWLPAIALIDWMIAPDRGRARWRSVVFVIGYALTWGGITMARGSVVGWYPYFFLDPGQVDGPGEFLLLSGAALALFALVTSGVVAISRTGAAPRTADVARPRRKGGGS